MWWILSLTVLYVLYSYLQEQDDSIPSLTNPKKISGNTSVSIRSTTSFPGIKKSRALSFKSKLKKWN